MGKPFRYDGYQFLESQIRYVMENTFSNKEAAAWLNVSYDTWRKYAKMYIDPVSGKSLFDLHLEKGMQKILAKPKNYKLPGKPRRPGKGFESYDIYDIVAGKHPLYWKQKSLLKGRLIHEGVLPECCSRCGFSERRVWDQTVPLKLCYRDFNDQNILLENLYLLCYNCNYIEVGNPLGANRHAELSDQGFLVPKKKSRIYTGNKVKKDPEANPSP
jgi:hypothetical protein